MTTNKLLNKTKKINIFCDKTTLFYSALSLCVLIIIIMLVSSPAKYSSCTMQGLNLFITAVLPGLFPFMIFTKLLTNLGMVKKMSEKFSPLTKLLFNTNGISSYVFLMSILSGYPIGAKIISDLYVNQTITQKDAQKMISFCTTSGPIFIIGSVGAFMFGSAKIGLIIYISHILSSIMCGIILSGKRTKQPENTSSAPSKLLSIDQILSSTISSSIESIFVVGAYITIFFLLAQILTDIGLLKGIEYLISLILKPFKLNMLSSGITGSILEVTRGCKLLSMFGGKWPICFACSAISFSGLSIIFQSYNFLSKANIKLSRLILTKLLHAVLSFGVCYLFCLIML